VPDHVPFSHIVVQVSKRVLNVSMKDYFSGVICASVDRHKHRKQQSHSRKHRNQPEPAHLAAWHGFPLSTQPQAPHHADKDAFIHKPAISEALSYFSHLPTSCAVRAPPPRC
jgi:hypothetical protein